MAYEIFPKKLKFIYKSYLIPISALGKSSWKLFTKEEIGCEDIPGYTRLILSRFGAGQNIDVTSIGDHIGDKTREWISGKSYSVGDIVTITETSWHNTTISLYTCATANSDTVFDPTHWTKNEDPDVYFIRFKGNGTSSSSITVTARIDILWVRDDLVSIIPYKAPTT